MAVNCSNCHTSLQIPSGAQSIRCPICHAINPVIDPALCLPPPSSSSSSSSSSDHHNRDDYPHAPPPMAPSPYNHAPLGPPPSVHGRKRAVICGISYKNSRRELKGCINDAKYMKYLLVKRFNFPESSILMLTEEEDDPCRHPTKSNIRMALCWLVQGCQAGDSLVFHYSGHGSQQRNDTGDEIDGYDETLCPVDYETQGMIVDDEINATIVRPLPLGVKLHAIVDACHSGTVLDLPFLCRMERNGSYMWEDQRPRSGMWKGTSGGEVICFSSCDDSQTSADSSDLSRITSSGAMTYSFIQAIERGHGTTYGAMLNAMRSNIDKRDNQGGGGIVSSVLTLLLPGGNGGGLKQEPQLSANETFNVYSKPFSL
ncbi:hypothetical protein I3843_08G044100 [Carya illinoinensis]|uniref:Metacaspase-1-like n=1 Tax=Carya illinoinensis TaxID=32201 RepID=A0A922EBR5_CARIL|nr:hypothetical protein I3842_08G044400 [Carya illinoinensis]KAG7966305.1 hypothetical protein I3843_08G044100 [Carya illinoinensis]